MMPPYYDMPATACLAIYYRVYKKVGNNRTHTARCSAYWIDSN
jgi:hypothetical protein